jgi:ribonucleoside-triphosphate reductase
LSPTYSVCRNHGYITGEVYTCPDCGEKTEVYSRITGYYRPVQNWNDGKSAEFKERKTYSVDTALTKELGNKKCDSDACCDTAEKLLLITTKTCPNCRVAISMLDKAGVSYIKYIAEEDPDVARKYEINQAPTLVAVCGDGYKKYVGIAGVKDYIASL